MRARKRAAVKPVESREVASRVGRRIRAARIAAGLTQQQLAGERYTKAYVSALENAHVKPSMVALDYLASRLGTTASRLIAADEPEWDRVAADMDLARGRWQAAADAYARLAAAALDRGQRAELLRGLAQALLGAGRPAEAEQAATEAAGLFEQQGREADWSEAGYWRAAALLAQDSPAEAKSVLDEILDRGPLWRSLDPRLRLRVVVALAACETQHGDHVGALSHLEEMRSLAEMLDARQRAGYLLERAHSMRQAGDIASALRTGYASLALFDQAAAESEVAVAESELALVELARGNPERADELASGARGRLERLGARALLAEVIVTQAQIAAGVGKWADALRLAGTALELAEEAPNPKAAVGALLTTARARNATGEQEAAMAAYERAADLARSLNRPAMLRETLGAWAEALAAAGDHAGAYRLTREALGAA